MRQTHLLAREPAKANFTQSNLFRLLDFISNAYLYTFNVYLYDVAACMHIFMHILHVCASTSVMEVGIAWPQQCRLALFIIASVIAIALSISSA